MVTYYTALGRMVSKHEKGIKTPMIIIDDAEYSMDVDELIVWGCLHWNFLDKDTLEKEYSRRKAKYHIFNDISFENTLKRLEVRGLVISGTNYLAVDALYDLVSKLKIRPIRMSVMDKLRSVAYMYFVKGISFNKCISAYFRTSITPNERNVLKLSKKVGLTTSEIIKCAEEKIKSIDSEAEVMDKLYDDNTTTQETITTKSRFSDLKNDVVKAVANLYLKKKIVFEN